MAEIAEITRRKFADADRTADGQARAVVPFVSLRTLWVNTGTLCNIECVNCYIESGPKNDRLAYLSAAELSPFLKEAAALGASEIGFTGGEPFMNPQIDPMLREALDSGLDVLVLTNAMRPMMRPKNQALLRDLSAFGDRLTLRVSLDHFTRDRHDQERGRGAFDEAMTGLSWLGAHGFRIAVAGRRWAETDAAARAGYAALFAERSIGLDAFDPQSLVLFPEMDETKDAPEITTACWDILDKEPATIMCASARMVAKRKGAEPTVMACTLIAYDPQFELGPTLATSLSPVKLNHPHCSRFCVLGGSSCS